MRLPRKQSLLVALQVRGKTLVFQNKHGTVILAFQDTEKEDLHWFLQELYKDIQRVKGRVKGKEEPAEHAESDDDAEHAESDDDAEPAEHAESDKKKRRLGLPEDLKEYVTVAFASIREHAQCLTVNYFPSKNSFHVTRKSDRSSKFFRLLGLDALRREKDHAKIQQRFDMVLLQIQNHLDSSSSSAPAGLGPEVLENGL